MAHMGEVIQYLDGLLDIDGFDDYCPNGLQVPGADEVTVVATGVSAHRELFEQATRLGRSWWSRTTACSGTSTRARCRPP